MGETIKLRLIRRVWYKGRYKMPKGKKRGDKRGLRCGNGCPLVMCIAEFESFFKVSVWAWFEGVHSGLLKTKNYYKKDLTDRNEKQSSLIAKDFCFELNGKASEDEKGEYERVILKVLK